MLSKEEKGFLRNKLFRHLDGVVTCPAAYLLHERGVTGHLLSQETSELSELVSQFKANDGYLNVALRSLCSQGWLNQKVDNEHNRVSFSINDNSALAFAHFEMYKEAAELLRMTENYHARKFQKEPFVKLEKVFHDFKDRCGFDASQDERARAIQDQILLHIEGIILGPTLVHLGMGGMFHKYFMETRFRAEEFHKNPEVFERLLDIMTDLNCFTKSKNSYQFTEQGLFFAKRASAYGVTVSYLPTLRKLDELIFGNPTAMRIGDGAEAHVDREMNVWGSGGAHASYFKVVDKIIIDIFNKPIAEQPKGILDMGCGNGAFLQHLFSVIENQTTRGTMLEDYPLTLIGVDYNQAALQVSKRNLIQADIWAKIIWGDIGNPQGLAADLQENYDIDLGELLNVRTFLDHNRIWEEPAVGTGLKVCSSTGSFATKGKRIDNNLVIESLKQHFKKWEPYIKRHGLLLIELHTVDPGLVARNLGRTAATAYDATHGYSDQYIVEIDAFLKALQEIGLNPDPSAFRKFPDSDFATVSINLLSGKA